jgi:hypothetical protein
MQLMVESNLATTKYGGKSNLAALKTHEILILPPHLVVKSHDFPLLHTSSGKYTSLQFLLLIAFKFT